MNLLYKSSFLVTGHSIFKHLHVSSISSRSFGSLQSALTSPRAVLLLLLLLVLLLLLLLLLYYYYYYYYY